MLSRVFERNKKNGRVIELIRDWNLIPLSFLENLNETGGEEGTVQNPPNARVLRSCVNNRSYGSSFYVIEREKKKEKKKDGDPAAINVIG